MNTFSKTQTFTRRQFLSIFAIGAASFATIGAFSKASGDDRAPANFSPQVPARSKNYDAAQPFMLSF